MTKDQLIDEFLKQGIKKDSMVKIVVLGEPLVGSLTDAKIKSPDDDCEYHLIGLVLTASPGKIISKAPHPVAVELIESIELLS